MTLLDRKWTVFQSLPTDKILNLHEARLLFAAAAAAKVDPDAVPEPEEEEEVKKTASPNHFRPFTESVDQLDSQVKSSLGKAIRREGLIKPAVRGKMGTGKLFFLR